MTEEPKSRRAEEPKSSEPQADPVVSVVGPGGAETIVPGTMRMHILADGSHTGHRLAIAESDLAPHPGTAAQHRHAQHDEGFPAQYFRDLQEVFADGRPPTPHANLDAMNHYTTEPSTDLA
jgi:hypothetical protein